MGWGSPSKLGTSLTSCVSFSQFLDFNPPTFSCLDYKTRTMAPSSSRKSQVMESQCLVHGRCFLTELLLLPPSSPSNKDLKVKFARIILPGWVVGNNCISSDSSSLKGAQSSRGFCRFKRMKRGINLPLQPPSSEHLNGLPFMISGSPQRAPAALPGSSVSRKS